MRLPRPLGRLAVVVRAGRSHVLCAAAAARRRTATGVALTFDDGPHPSSTPLVLDVLADHSVRATFFCVGRNALAHPDLVRRARAEGHAVGSHSFTHPYPDRLSLARLRQDYRDGRAAVSDVVGEDVALFRPPHGHLGLGSAAMVRGEGLDAWLWTVDPEDWRPGAEATRVAAVAESALPGDVVLLHDWVEQPEAPQALDRTATVEALTPVIQRLRAEGVALSVLEPRW